MTGHGKVGAYAGSGGPCGDGYHHTQYGCCSCGWQVAVDWSGNTCTCVGEHSADGLLESERLANKLLNRHIARAKRDSDDQGVLL